MNRVLTRAWVPLAGLALVGSGFAAGITATASAAGDDPAPVTVTRQDMAEVAAPPGAPRRTLGLSKVIVMPGAQLASHHHPGAQLGYVAEGALTYTVESGHAKVMKGPGDAATVVKRLGPGDTVKVRAGQWLSEQQDEVHHATNAGAVPIVIYIATLLRTGEPAAISD